MDTSKEYIEMCRKAVEIQEAWKPRWGDFYEYDEDEQILPINIGELRRFIPLIKQKRIIWLPRQDQLQEMVKDFHYQRSLKDLHLFSLHTSYIHSLISIWSINSLEQLWLAFVMYEKYGKKWDGEEWIKE